MFEILSGALNELIKSGSDSLCLSVFFFDYLYLSFILYTAFLYISLFLSLSLFSSVFPLFISPYNYIIVTLPFEKTLLNFFLFYSYYLFHLSICLSFQFFLSRSNLSFFSLHSFFLNCVFLSLLFYFLFRVYA